MSPNNFTASKYITHNMLLSSFEINELLPEGFYVILGVLLDDPVISKETFIQMAETDNPFLIGFAYSLKHFEFVNTPRGKIARIKKPVVEIKPFSFTITSEKKILEDVLVKESIKFGLSFSYPRLFSIDKQVEKTKDFFKEADFFDAMRKFKRKKTKPVFLDYCGKRLVGSFRMGNEAKKQAQERIATVEGLSII
ncbi:MAG: hypothetical protein S4CHLAM20_14160 [Chlamydiia bacterium]|nr:hypothetical protein [Chlamydiia bacterium]